MSEMALNSNVGDRRKSPEKKNDNDKEGVETPLSAILLECFCDTWETRRHWGNFGQLGGGVCGMHVQVSYGVNPNTGGAKHCQPVPLISLMAVSAVSHRNVILRRYSSVLRRKLGGLLDGRSRGQ